jgi:drug/metabolite transporter (DMT)-like permease
MKMNRFRIAVSAACDVIASTFQCISLNFIQASSYQIMRGGTIATTFMFSVLYLKIKPQKKQILGSILTFAGVLAIGIENMIFSEAEDQD